MSIKTNFKERETWLKQFALNYSNQDWHINKVYHPKDLNHFSFFKPYKEYTIKINPKNIIGIKYGYAYNCPLFGKKNINWSYLLENLKRLDNVIDNKNSQTELRLKDHIHKNIDQKRVLKYGGHYFTFRGQHRLCLAKYLEIDEVEVKVYEMKFDKKKFLLEKSIEKAHTKLVNYKLVEDVYIQDLKNDYLQVKLMDEYISIPKEIILKFISRYEDLKNNKYKKIPIILKYFFGSINNEKFFITSEVFKDPKKLLALDFKIIKHINN